MLRLLVAPAGNGKTETILQRIRQTLAEQPLSPVIAIVPNVIQAAAFRQRLADAGGALGVEVYTFHSLYAELLNRAGQPIPLLPDPVRLHLLRGLVAELYRQGQLRHYGALRDKPGFIAALRNTIEELKRARIFPEAFVGAARQVSPQPGSVGAGPRLVEISQVYRAYQSWLQAQNWADAEGRGWLAAIALEQHPTLAAEIRLLAVCGFDEFNPTQLSVFSLLAKRAAETLITLTGDVERPQRLAQRRFHRAQRMLVESLGVQPEGMGTVSQLAPDIARVEEILFEPASPPPGDVPQAQAIEFLEAQTRSAEARAALRWAKARVLRDGLLLSQVAILARDLETYRPFLEETAEEFGIPLRVVGGRPLAENTAVAALLSLLSLPAEDWRRPPFIEAWRCPYFDWSAYSISPLETALLDEISRQGLVVAGLSQWREALALWQTRQEVAGEDGDVSAPGQKSDGATRAFESFVALLTPPDRASTREYIAFVEALMGEDPPAGGDPSSAGGGLRVVARAYANSSTAEWDLAALNAFKDVLRGLALSEAALGEETLAYADFFTTLRAATAAVAFTPPMQAGVMVASVLDSRGLAFQAAAVLGLAEGEFPKAEREDVMLRERDRAALRERGLPLETHLHGDEASLFYQAVTRARRRLLLTRPYLSEDGQPWEASAYWDEVYRLAGKPAVKRVRSEDRLDPADAASPVEWREAAHDFDVHLQRGVDTLLAQLNPKTAGKLFAEPLDLSERFGAAHTWSASRLESYGACPFEFFVAYVLELEPREEPVDGFDVRMLGSMLHKILEEHYREKELEAAAQEVFSSAPRVYGFRPTPLWEVQQKELLKRLVETVSAMGENSLGYTPLAQEQKFGLGAPPLVLKTEAGDVRLHGYIDRIDRAPDGSLRVIDYKLGGSAISLAHLKEGRRLQLPIYAMAVEKVLGLGEVSSGFYWHIQKAEASSMRLEKLEGGVGEAFAIAIAHIGRHVAGIRAGRFEAKAPAEGCPAYCPAVSFCWKYKKGF